MSTGGVLIWLLLSALWAWLVLRWNRPEKPTPERTVWDEYHDDDNLDAIFMWDLFFDD